MCKQSLPPEYSAGVLPTFKDILMCTLIKGTLQRLQKKTSASWCSGIDQPTGNSQQILFKFCKFKLCWLQTYNSYYLPHSPESEQEVPKGKKIFILYSLFTTHISFLCNDTKEAWIKVLRPPPTCIPGLNQA